MKVHFTGACGRALGSLALDLQRRGWAITASDASQFAPMDAELRGAGLRIAPKFSGRQVPADVDVVVKGVTIPSDNPELRTARRRGIPVMNMAQFIGTHLFEAANRRLVVAGTNGKTTTTTMLAWILEHAGLQPDFLFAGRSRNFDIAVRFRGRRLTVLEGDEYWAANDDRRPKFDYYRPDHLVLTNVQFDHAEIYRDLGDVEARFRSLVAGLPRKGSLTFAADCPHAAAIAAGAKVATRSVGFARDADMRIEGVRASRDGMSFRLDGQRFRIAQFGRMNVIDAALAALAARQVGVGLDAAAKALAEYRGVRGRLEAIIDRPDGALIVDEGYHPAALRENIAALRLRYTGRRLLVMLQPRYTGGRDGFQSEQLPAVLAEADRVILASPFDLAEPPSGRFSNPALAARLGSAGVPVHFARRLLGLHRWIAKVWERGDVLLCSLPPGTEFITEPLARRLNALADR